MPSSLERRLGALEGREADARPAAHISDAELLLRIGWRGFASPTDDELRALAAELKKRGSNDDH